MRLALLGLLISNVAYANDLIFLQGFENNALVSGTVLGLNSSGLILKLSTTNGAETLEFDIDVHAGFVFSLPITTGSQWEVTLTSLPNDPNQQSCILSNSLGVMPSVGVNNVLVECSDEQWRWDVMKWNEGGWQ